MKKIFLLLLPILLISCSKSKEIKSAQGGIDIISNIYFNASQGLEDSKQFHISKINYIGDDIVELVPNVEIAEVIDSVYYIRDTTFYRAGTVEESKHFIFKYHQMVGDPESIYKKNYGAVWLNTPIFDYDKRKNIADTILYDNKVYKRFEINTKENYTVFYIYQTDTILPYSLNKIAEKDYKGRIERIDSYDKTKDLFSTMWLIARKTVDLDAKKIFEYNTYIDGELEKRKKEKKY